jgi:uncharacterized membrane protein HdeD (DUF308 family)
MSKQKHQSKSFMALAAADLIIIALGVCLIAWAGQFTSIISIVIGILFGLYGLYDILAYLRAKESNRDISRVIAGIALLAGGAFLILQNGFIKDFISVFVGICIIVESLSKFQDTMALKSAGFKDYKRPLIFSIIGIVCGVLCVVGKIIVPNLFLQILGVMMIIFSVSNIVTANILGKNDTAAKTRSAAADQKAKSATEAETTKK